MPEHNTVDDNISTLEHLRCYVDLSSEEMDQIKQIIQIHPMRISPYYLSLIDWNDPNDPIRKIAVPNFEELNVEGFYDTSGESENTKMPGLQHKYSETALILATNKCAMYCRYCFRKRLVGLPTDELLKRFEDAATYIREHEEINNVLVSGGDPLVLQNDIIESFLESLTDIRHLKFIRFGSRVPVTLPERLNDPEILRIFRKYSRRDKRVYVVTQFNHPREITPKSINAVNWSK